MEQDFLLLAGALLFIVAPLITLIRYFLTGDRRYHHYNDENGFDRNYHPYDSRSGHYPPGYYAPRRYHGDPDDEYYDDDEYHRRYAGRYGRSRYPRRRHDRERSNGFWMFMMAVVFLGVIVYFARREEKPTIVYYPKEQMDTPRRNPATQEEMDSLKRYRGNWEEDEAPQRHAKAPDAELSKRGIESGPQPWEAPKYPSYESTDTPDYQVYGRSYPSSEQAKNDLQGAADCLGHKVHYGERNGGFVLFLQAETAIERRELIQLIQSKGAAARKYFPEATI
jgi:hypothetical protein